MRSKLKVAIRWNAWLEQWCWSVQGYGQKRTGWASTVCKAFEAMEAAKAELSALAPA